MRQITLLITMFVFTFFGYSQQDVLQDFENGGLDSPFGGAITSLVPDPETGGTHGQVLRLESDPNEAVFQGVNISFESQDVELTSNKTMTLDVYSTMPITIAPKVIQGSDGAPDSTASVDHGGSGWETLTVTFNEGLDNTTTADGIYGAFVIYLNWDNSIPGFGTPDDKVFFVDEIKGIGFTSEPDPEPSTAAPVPTVPDSEVYSIYNDVPGFTTNFPVQYDFGTLIGEPDLDPSATENKAYKFDFGVAGWGQGEGGPDDVSAFNFVSFDYWAGPTVVGFDFVLISNDGAVTEHKFQVSIDGDPIVNEAWTKVEIPLSFFTNIGFVDTSLFQWKVSPLNDSVDNDGIVYIDNILLTQNTLGTDDFSSNKFSAYPNPTLDKWNVKATSSNIQNVEIYNTLGRLVKEVSVNNDEASIDASDLSTGIYFAKIYDANGQFNTVKLIKK